MKRIREQTEIQKLRDAVGAWWRAGNEEIVWYTPRAKELSTLRDLSERLSAANAEIKRLVSERNRYVLFRERERARRAAYFARTFPKIVKRMPDGRLLCVEDVRGGCSTHWICRTPDGRLHRSFKAALSHIDNEKVLAEQKEALRRQQIVERRLAWEREQERRKIEKTFRQKGLSFRDDPKPMVVVEWGHDER
jgi:hypothetical protein